MSKPRLGRRERLEKRARAARIARSEQGIAPGNYVSVWDNPRPRGKASPDWSYNGMTGRRIHHGH